MALLRFHLASGVRLALRVSVPLAGAWAAVIGLSPDPSAALASIASGLSSTARGGFFPALWTLQAVLLAAWASPRVGYCACGWLRHLPASSAEHRHSLILALAASQAPVACSWALAWLGAAWYGLPVSTVRLAGIPAVVIAAAFMVAPVRRRLLAVAVAVAALLLAMAGTWPAWSASMVLLFLAEAGSGRVSGRRSKMRRSSVAWPASRLPAVIAMRSMGGRLAGWFLLSFLPLVSCRFFLANNMLEPTAVTRAGRLSGGVAAAILFAGCSGLLAVRRPPWPWARSLPWSSTRRILMDSSLLSVLAVPLLAFTFISAPATLPPLLITTLFLAVRSSTGIRRWRNAKTGPGGPVLAEGLFLAVWVAVLPWLSLLLLALLPVAVRDGARAESSLKVSAWSERHHLAAGDPISWSAR